MKCIGLSLDMVKDCDGIHILGFGFIYIALDSPLFSIFSFGSSWPRSASKSVNQSPSLTLSLSLSAPPSLHPPCLSRRHRENDISFQFKQIDTRPYFTLCYSLILERTIKGEIKMRWWIYWTWWRVVCPLFCSHHHWLTTEMMIYSPPPHSRPASPPHTTPSWYIPINLRSIYTLSKNQGYYITMESVSSESYIWDGINGYMINDYRVNYILNLGGSIQQ